MTRAFGLRPAPRRRGRSAGCGGLLLLLAGCGHPATRAECEEIFARSAEIELRAQGVTEPAAVRERTEAVRAARGEELISQCVGKRVTEGALTCVRTAAKPADVDACLR